jgi:hypothetical protein
MYLLGSNSMTSGASSSRLPIVAPLTIERPNVAFSDVIIRNDNISAIEVIEYKLSACRNVRELVSHAASLLHEANGFGEHVKADGWSTIRSIGEHMDALKVEILPEVDAAIERLETEVGR